MEIEQTLSEIERFFERAAEVDGLRGYQEVLEPATDAAIEALVAKSSSSSPTTCAGSGGAASRTGRSTAAGLEAGCFSSHAITKYLPKVQHLVPGRIPPEKNLWIAYYKKVFAEYA